MKPHGLYALTTLAALVVTIAGSLAMVTLADENRPAPPRTRVSPAAADGFSAPVPSSETLILAAATPVPPTAVPSPSPTATPTPVTITVTNEDCVAADYYVDGSVRTAAMEEGATATFPIAQGTHSVQVCQAGTSECSDSTTVTWTQSAEVAIARGACPVTVTVVNGHCGNADLYVDDQLTVIDLPQGATKDFTLAPGKHSIYACPVGTQNCGEPIVAEWATATTLDISPAQTCP